MSLSPVIPFGMKLGSGVTVSRYIAYSMIPAYIGNTIAGEGLADLWFIFPLLFAGQELHARAGNAIRCTPVSGASVICFGCSYVQAKTQVTKEKRPIIVHWSSPAWAYAHCPLRSCVRIVY